MLCLVVFIFRAVCCQIESILLLRHVYSSICRIFACWRSLKTGFLAPQNFIRARRNAEASRDTPKAAGQDFGSEKRAWNDHIALFLCRRARRQRDATLRDCT